MDFSFQNEDLLGSNKPDAVIMMTVEREEGGTVGAAPPEEYDPSQPLDSSDEEEPLAGLNFEKDDPESDINIEIEPQPPPIRKIPMAIPTISSKPPEIDLSSIPMPSDEYRRPAIQFSIPTRHRLMSISSLIKRQKGVMKKQDRGGLSYNSEISKAFLKSDSGGEGLSSEEGLGEDGRPKISLVQEIFGSDDEDGKEEGEEEEEDGEEPPSHLELSLSGDEPCSQAMISTACDDENDEELNIMDNPVVPEVDEEEANKMWKNVSETSQDGGIDLGKNLISCIEETSTSGTPPYDPDAGNSNDVVGEEMQISIKPSSELLEDPASDGGESSEIEVIETHRNGSGGEDKRGKENKHILECVSDEEPEFEVTFVAMGKSNLTRPRGKPFRIERRVMEKVSLMRKKSLSPLNGFEEGEIIDHLDRKKKKGKKKKSKKRKRSKDSRVSTKINSERSTAESVEKKSYSPNSDGKEVSWRKPSKLTKSRNYRNGKQDSEEKYPGVPKHDDSSRRKGRSPIRYAAQGRSRRNRSISNGRFRSRSRSGSKDSIPTRWESRYRGAKRTTNRGGSHRSHSSLSNHSSHSHSRSRSLNRKRGKRRHSPSPLRKRRSDRSISRSRISKSPRPQKRNKSNGTESNRRERVKERSPPHRSKSPADTHSSKKNVKTKIDEVPVEDSKKKPRKERTNSDEVDKEKRKKRKRREKSLSPVKAIVADGDSIVVSLSFQKAKEEVVRMPKVIPLTKYESSGEKEKGSFTPEDDESDDSAKAVDSKIDRIVNKKGTITINLDLSPGHIQDLRQSPDIVVLHDESADHSSKSHELKNGKEPKLDLKNSSTATSQRTEGVDFVSSSHDSSAENVQQISSTPSDPKTTATPERAASASKSPYKFSDYFVSSTCDVGKTSSPAIEAPSPKNLSSSKLTDSVDNLMNQKASDRSPFTSSEMSSQGNSTETGLDKPTTPAQDTLHTHSTKNFMAQFSSKPMIGNIPGLFPSGFSTGVGGGISAAPIVIPAPPRIIPNTHSPNLLNPNVLVSVASALYAPLLAAKQNQNTSGPSGQTMMNVRHSLPGNMYSKNVGMQNQTLNLGHYNRATNNGTGASGVGGDSPFSPNSSDGDDLFEPPGDGKGQDSGLLNKKSSGSDPLHLPNNSSANNRSPAFGKYPAESSGQDKRHLFNTLFSTTPKKSAYQKHGKKKPSHLKKSKPRKAKRSEADKNGDQEMTTRLTEEVPTSAVALKMKEKFLKKLNRQERVVEEVKLSLKPHYSKKHVSKDEYKEILRRAVPKICHNKSGEINPNKIKELVEAYVKKFRIARKTDSKAI